MASTDDQEDGIIITFSLRTFSSVFIALRVWYRHKHPLLPLLVVFLTVPVLGNPAGASGGPWQPRWEYGVFVVSTRYGVASDGVRTLQYRAGSWKNGSFNLGFNNAVNDRSYERFARKLSGRAKLSCVTCELPVLDALGNKGWELASHNKDASDSIYQAQAHTLTVTDTYWFKRTR